MKAECIGDFVKLKDKLYPCNCKSYYGSDRGKMEGGHPLPFEGWRKALHRTSQRIVQCHNVTEMTLSLQLKQLEKDGLVTRNVFGTKPPLKVVYNLTDFGRSTIPILNAITEWGNSVVQEKGEFVTHSLR